MDKKLIETFISKYSVGGEVESVNIASEKDALAVDFISDDKTLLGNVKSDVSGFPEGSFSIYTTSQLKSMLGILENSIDVKSNVNKKSNDVYISFSDKSTSVNYMLSDPSVIPAVPPLQQLPQFEAELNIDNDFIAKYIKAKSAIDSDKFTFVCVSGKAEIILGYSTINTNRISIEVDAECEGDIEPISFNATYLKEILSSNRDSKLAKMQISTKGLCYVNFETDESTSKYYLVEIK